MDHFGIGTAVEGAAKIYFRSARQTGRTTSLLESVKDGDRIVFAVHGHAEHMRRLLAERGVAVACIVVPPSNAEKVMQHGTSQGRTLFDHMWLEQYYLEGIKVWQGHVDYLERQCSGEGEAHRETRRKAEEIARWRIVP